MLTLFSLACSLSLTAAPPPRSYCNHRHVCADARPQNVPERIHPPPDRPKPRRTKPRRK